MTYGPFMVGAFSHCTNVGKLPKQLPGIPIESKVFLNRYDFMEASVMLKLYIRYLFDSSKFCDKRFVALVCDNVILEREPSNIPIILFFSYL